MEPGKALLFLEGAAGGGGGGSWEEWELMGSVMLSKQRGPGDR